MVEWCNHDLNLIKEHWNLLADITGKVQVGKNVNITVFTKTNGFCFLDIYQLIRAGYQLQKVSINALVSRIERSYKSCKFYEFSLNSTRYTKIRCLNNFSVRCAKIYDFMLIEASTGLRILQNLRFFTTFTIFQYVIVKFAIFCTSLLCKFHLLVSTCGFYKICDFSQLTINTKGLPKTTWFMFSLER